MTGMETVAEPAVGELTDSVTEHEAGADGTAGDLIGHTFRDHVGETDREVFPSDVDGRICQPAVNDQHPRIFFVGIF